MLYKEMVKNLCRRVGDAKPASEGSTCASKTSLSDAVKTTHVSTQTDGLINNLLASLSLVPHKDARDAKQEMADDQETVSPDRTFKSPFTDLIIRRQSGERPRSASLSNENEVQNVGRYRHISDSSGLPVESFATPPSTRDTNENTRDLNQNNLRRDVDVTEANNANLELPPSGVAVDFVKDTINKMRSSLNTDSNRMGGNVDMGEYKTMGQLLDETK